MVKTKPAKKFGEIALERGYITRTEVEKALTIQKRKRVNGVHELIGIIMLKAGMLTNDQIIDILRFYEHEEDL
ncbi:MAG: hypothetical protein ABIF71_04235 [Planctomycetota bacterium]